MQEPTETSVLISLKELVALESERLQEEQQEREAARADVERAHALDLERRRAEEAARLAAEEHARAERARAAAEETARLQALQQATIERARVVAQAAAEQELVEAQHRHERELATLNNDKQRGGYRTLGIAGVVVALLAGGLAVKTLIHLSGVEETNDAHVAELNAEKERMLRSRLASLDGFADQLGAQVDKIEAAPPELTDARAELARVRADIAAVALEDAPLDRYEAALGHVVQQLTRAHRLSRHALLDGVHDEMRGKVAAIARPGKDLSAADSAASEARAAVDAHDPRDEQLSSYDKSLRQLASAINAVPTVGPKIRQLPPKETAPFEVCDYHDPLCGQLPGDKKK